MADKRVLVSGAGDKTVRLWAVAADGKGATHVSTLSGHTKQVSALAYVPNKRVIATGSWDKSVRLWTLAANGSSATGVSKVDSHKH